MNRFAAALVALMALVPATAPAQRDYSKVEVKAVKLTDSVYVLTGAGGNMGLSVGEDAVFLIDDQFAPLTDKIIAAIAKITPRPVKFVVNTHWHGDHTGGNENLGKAGALLVAHENVRKRMSTEQFIEAWGKIPPSPRGALPVVTFAGAVSFHINGDEIRAIHVPNAHTDGDAIVHFLKNDVIHMGDIYWNGQYPFIDIDSGGSVDGTIAAVDKILAIATDSTRIIAGHGPAVSNKAELKAYRDVLADVASRVREMVRAGRKPEEIVAANPSAPHDARYGTAYIKGPKFVETLVKDMMRR